MVVHSFHEIKSPGTRTAQTHRRDREFLTLEKVKKRDADSAVRTDRRIADARAEVLAARGLGRFLAAAWRGYYLTVHRPALFDGSVLLRVAGWSRYTWWQCRQASAI
jgi:hypothetical protein